MAPRPTISNRTLPQVRGTPMNPGALTTQLNTHGTAVASSTETQTMSNPVQHAQLQRALPTTNGSRPITPPSFSNPTAITDVAEQMRSIIERLERQPPTAENRAQAAAMARNLAELREKMDAAASAAQPRLSADAPEFMPSPSHERGRQGAPSAGNERDAVGGGNPLNGVVLPTFIFTSESPNQPQQQYTQEEMQTQIAAIYGSSAQNNGSQLPVVNGSGMASFHGHMEPITINPVTGRPRTPLSHLTAISNNARRRSQERAEREAASQAQLDQVIQQNLAQEQQMQQAQQLQAQQLQQAQQAQQVQAQHMQAHQFQQAQQAQQAQAQAQAQQLQQAQSQALQAYQGRQAHQGQQPPQSLQMPQPHHQPHHFQGQQPSNGQIFNHIQQNLQFAPQQPQQQYPFGMNDMSYGQSNHSHMHPQQQMGNDFAFNNMQDFTQGPPVGPFIPQTYEMPSMGQFSTQPVTQQHQNMPFNNVNPLPAQPETQNRISLTLTPDAPVPTGPSNGNVTAGPSMMTKFRDIPPQTHSKPAVDGSSDDVAGYFPSAYELTGKWNTLPAIMRTPPQMPQQPNGRDKTRNGDDPDNGGPGAGNGANGGVNGNGNGNGNMSLPAVKSPRNGATGDVNGNGHGNGSTTLQIAKRTSGQNGKTHSRGPSQDNSTTHKNGNTRPQSASHTWRSHTHTISGDFTTLRRNAGHLDLLGSPAFPVSASEYAGLRADTLAEKQARLTAQLGEMMKAKKEAHRVGEAMRGKTLYGYSAVLAEKEDVWNVHGGSGAGYPSVAEMKREHALLGSETGSSPGRFFPRPKGMVASVQQGYMGVSESDLALANMPREDWSVKSVEKARAWENELAWGEMVAKASKEAAQKVNQIPMNDSEWLVGQGLLDRLV